ncbi:MAG TPA: PAS domain S-box protein, partial [Magnetovibrio sp.]
MPVTIAKACTGALLASWTSPALALDAVNVAVNSDESLDHGILLATALGLLLALVLLGMLYVRLRRSNRRAIEAEQQLKLAIDNISDGFAIYNAEDRLVMCNEQLRLMYPAIADRLTPGVKCGDMARALSESGALAPNLEGLTVEQNVAKLTCGSGDTEVQLRDGRWILHRDRKLPDGGKVGVRTDITYIKKRESQLQDSAVRYRDMVERSPVPIFVHRDGVVLYANTATADILGYSAASDIIGKNILTLIHPDHHKLALRRQEQANKSVTPLGQVDMKFLRPDGTTIYTEVRVSPSLYDGRPALESILYDISARRRTERALMESEQRYRNLFELSPDAILVHDGNHVLFANDTAARMLGAENDTSLFGAAI